MRPNIYHNVFIIKGHILLSFYFYFFPSQGWSWPDISLAKNKYALRKQNLKNERLNIRLSVWEGRWTNWQNATAWWCMQAYIKADISMSGKLLVLCRSDWAKLTTTQVEAQSLWTSTLSVHFSGWTSYTQDCWDAWTFSALSSGYVGVKLGYNLCWLLVHGRASTGMQSFNIWTQQKIIQQCCFITVELWKNMLKYHYLPIFFHKLCIFVF